MPTGFAHAGSCYATQHEAAEVFAASAFPRVSEAGGCLHMQSASVTGGLVTVSTEVQPSSCAGQAPRVFAPEFVSCDPMHWTPAGPMLSVADAAQLSSAIVLLWLLAWGFKAVFRALRAGDQPAEE